MFYYWITNYIYYTICIIYIPTNDINKYLLFMSFFLSFSHHRLVWDRRQKILDQRKKTK